MNFDILLQKIKEYDKIAIFGHTRPDGDCYGSLNGLKNIILTTFPKKRVFCLTSHVESLSFLGKMDSIEDQEFEQVGITKALGLKSLEVEKFNLNPEFATEVYEYTITVENEELLS